MSADVERLPVRLVASLRCLFACACLWIMLLFGVICFFLIVTCFVFCFVVGVGILCLCVL